VRRDRTSDESIPSPRTKAAEHLERAYALEEQDRFREALDECDAAIHADASLAEAHNLRGLILEELDQGLEARLTYREAVRLNPSLREARENLLEIEAELQLGIVSGIPVVNRPVCSTPTDSLKRYRMPHWVVFFGIGARIKHGPYTACPRCMRRKLFSNVFSPLNILSANLLWFVLIVPYNLVLFIASMTRGHSKSVVDLLALSGQAS